jgi:hypothetical protein
MTYYVMMVKFEDDVDGWSPEFGDFDREVVEYEARDYRDDGHWVRIIKADATTGIGFALLRRMMIRTRRLIARLNRA